MVCTFGTPKPSSQPKASFSERKPQLESAIGSKKIQGCPQWLAVLLVRHGQFKFDGASVLSSGEFKTQFMEFGEICSDRKCEERSTYGGAPKRKELLHIFEEIRKQMSEGRDEALVRIMEKGWIKIPKRMTWTSSELRREAVRGLVASLDKDPRDITTQDFYLNRLANILNHYRNSPYRVISEAFPELAIRPWEMATTPTNYFNQKENRIAATKWLVAKLDKDPRGITQDDFRSNRLWGLFKHYHTSPYLAVSEAFPDIRGWEMAMTPVGFFNQKENRIAATKWLVAKLDKDPRNLTAQDFASNRLSGLIKSHYKNSSHAAVSEAFPELAIRPWEMAVTPYGFFNQKENRIAATKWLVAKLDKDPRNLTAQDFASNRLSGLIQIHYGNSPYSAVSEAFPEIRAWEMAVTPYGFFDQEENRIAATKWLVEKLGKDPRGITQADFYSNRLGGLLKHYKNSPYSALLEAGLVTAADEAYMRSNHHAH